MGDYDLILAYKDMKKISEICEENNINYSNLVNGKTSRENEKKVSEQLKREIYKIFSLFKMMEEN